MNAYQETSSRGSKNLNANLAKGLSRIIDYIRIIHNLNQDELAAILKTKQSAVSRLENGKDIPKLNTLMKIADAFGYKIHIKLVSEERHVVLDSEGMYRWDEHGYNWSLWHPDEL